MTSRVHPNFLSRPGDERILHAYARFSASGMGAAPVMPFAGGYLDQPAWITDLFEFLDVIRSRLKDRPEND